MSTTSSQRPTRKQLAVVQESWKATRRELLDLLEAHPEVLYPTLHFARSMTGSAATTPSPKQARAKGLLAVPLSEAEPWPATYHIHRKVPKYFWAQWLAAEVKAVAEPEVVLLIDSKDPQAIRALVEYGTGVGPEHVCPKQLRDKALLQKFLSWRHGQLGRRLEVVFQNHIDSSGSIAWQDFPVYSWVYDARGDGRRPVAVRHCSGVEVSLPLTFLAVISIDIPWLAPFFV
jgi:hypothetical protein